MKRTNSNQLQSSLDSFLVTMKKKKSVDAPTSNTTTAIEVTGSSELATTSAATTASTFIATQHVEHAITERRDIMDSDIQNRNDSPVDIVVPFSENDQILTEPGPATATIAKTFSSQISNAGFINDIGNYVGTIIDDLTKKIVKIAVETIS